MRRRRLRLELRRGPGAGLGVDVGEEVADRVGRIGEEDPLLGVALEPFEPPLASRCGSSLVSSPSRGGITPHTKSTAATGMTWLARTAVCAPKLCPTNTTSSCAVERLAG